jgi:2-iminobutanoate/2-iminopropanoate deaminase
MSKHPVSTDAAAQPLGAYAQAWRAGDFVFVAGVAPIDPATGAVQRGGLAEQTHRVLDNMTAVLAAEAADLDDVVKMNVYLANADDWADFNQAYADRLSAPYPARTSVQAGIPLTGMLVEMDCIAYVERG